MKHFTGRCGREADTGAIGGNAMKRIEIGLALDLGFRVAVLGILFVGAIISILPMS